MPPTVRSPGLGSRSPSRHDSDNDATQPHSQTQILPQPSNEQILLPSPPPPQMPPSPPLLLRLRVQDLSQRGSRIFLQSFDTAAVLERAVNTVLEVLYPPFQRPGPLSRGDDRDGGDASDGTGKKAEETEMECENEKCGTKRPAWPGTRSVTLVLASMEGVAFTKGIELDHDHKEIHLSSQYIQQVAGRRSRPHDQEQGRPQSKSDGDGNSGDGSGTKPASAPCPHLTHELTGVLVHEMVHCFQWNGHGHAPGGLIEGIADWVRLRARLGARHWPKFPQVGKDDTWDAGYERTAWFLDWLDRRYGAGSGSGSGTETGTSGSVVVRLNRVLRHVEYEEKRFWVRDSGLGKEVQVLWEEYKRWVGKRNGNGNGNGNAGVEEGGGSGEEDGERWEKVGYDDDDQEN